MSMALPTTTASVQRVLSAGIASVAVALLLAGCVNTRTTTTGLVGSGADSGAPVVTHTDENNRRRARLRMELAAGYFEQGQTSVALEELKQVLAIDPGYADAYNLRGLVYMRLEDAAQAEDSFRRAVAINPRDANTRHNYGWLLCQQNRYGDAAQQFAAALAVPSYADRAKTLMTQGVCELKAGQRQQAERSLLQAYELDAGNPVIGFNLASVLAQREEWSRAQFYARRVNNSPSANAETLWLGVKIERKLNNREAVAQLGGQLQRRFPQSREAMAYERGNFND
ncbi:MULTISPECIES: type IV pilus biogenesis/stability protein PilW [Variovorax]|uniref:Type IV pilus biogenesis/stability protein PilW n=1 Tax=Variovorax paradoxus TaxID=34073 RepID=A0A5Q0M9I7_VARPD|nr:MULTISPECIES: type IV pilus biogenesis/stability protein PilW [Variovorax]QFZ85294.1 type IV pilus biogenesis/stability protein PilW [Variovorax paradoxus]WPG35494.1 type IV pilus biogenesis/stability protein PilW [Variovorax boronicumulans]